MFVLKDIFPNNNTRMSVVVDMTDSHVIRVS